MKKQFLILALLFNLVTSVRADENVFGFVYTTETLPKGTWEVEQIYVGKYGKNHGSYANSFFRKEL